MSTEQVLQSAISKAALRVYSREELAQMTEQSGLSFRALLRRR